jgi:hypothetical protein
VGADIFIQLQRIGGGLHKYEGKFLYLCAGADFDPLRRWAGVRKVAYLSEFRYSGMVFDEPQNMSQYP